MNPMSTKSYSHHHPIIAATLEQIDNSRQHVLNAADAVAFLCDLIAQHPEACPSEHPTVQFTYSNATVVVTLCPERLSDVADFLRELRAREAGGRYNAVNDPDESRIHYYVGIYYIPVYLRKSCKFERIGTETKEVPIYKVVCEGAAS